MTQKTSPRQLIQAPHRLMFFIGAGNLTLAMLWWALWLMAARWHFLEMPEPPVHAGWVHAFVMQYLTLPSFIFGFLLTVFPRWMGLAEFERHRYVMVGAGLLGGQLAILLAAAGWRAGFVTGLWLALGGWSIGLLLLGKRLLQDRGRTWHARSCYAAMLLGYAGYVAFLAYVLGADWFWVFFSIKTGSIFLLLVYVTVAHRMFPFFAANVVPGYKPWRPMWWLAIVWMAALAHLALELRHAYAWLWLADVPLLALSCIVFWRWCPRRRMPGLLAVLFIGLAWLPVGFALYSAQSLLYCFTGEFLMSRAPMHALFVGFFGSVLIAMVTRVTQGHSGRPLRMPMISWLAFMAMQIVAATRVISDVMADPLSWQIVSAIGWVLVLVPWALRMGWIYLSPRADGRPG
ncbi:MAG: NnrS family protein [Xanthomonadaceae bacterium]|jgi:uncharacterized protein involved in response to NO|nr:NnrS family protein [Xanthomonadaceae bacterium]